MSEKLPAQHNESFKPKETTQSPEGRDRIKSLEKEGEREANKQPEQLKEAREQVERYAQHQENKHHNSAEKEQHTFSPATKGRQKKLAFKQTMKHTQAKLKPTDRVFSKVIHQPVIEKVSDISAKTLFRPSVTLGAALGALIGGAIFYGFARFYGFDLSGSEFLVCAVIGAVIGLVWEFAGFIARKLVAR